MFGGNPDETPVPSGPLGPDWGFERLPTLCEPPVAPAEPPPLFVPKMYGLLLGWLFPRGPGVEKFKQGARPLLSPAAILKFSMAMWCSDGVSIPKESIPRHQFV